MARRLTHLPSWSRRATNARVHSHGPPPKSHPCPSTTHVDAADASGHALGGGSGRRLRACRRKAHRTVVRARAWDIRPWRLHVLGRTVCEGRRPGALPTLRIPAAMQCLTRSTSRGNREDTSTHGVRLCRSARREGRRDGVPDPVRSGAHDRAIARAAALAQVHAPASPLVRGHGWRRRGGVRGHALVVVDGVRDRSCPPARLPGARFILAGTAHGARCLLRRVCRWPWTSRRLNAFRSGKVWRWA